MAFRLRASLVLAALVLMAPWLQAAKAPELAKGEAALDKKDYVGALAIFDAILKKDPADVAAHVGRGRAYRWREDFKNAQADYDEALRLDPKSKDALWHRHHLYSYQDEYQKALADIDALIAIEPDDALNFRARARSRRHLKDFAGALIDVERAIELNKNDATSVALRAWILYQAGSYSEAVEDYSLAIRLNGKDGDFYQSRGNAYVKMGRNADARADFEKAAQSADDDSYSNGYGWFLATTTDEALQDGAKAVVEATKACELSDWKVSGYVDTLAAACARAGDFESAVRWQTKAIDILEEGEPPKPFQDRLELYRQHQAYVEKPADPEKIAWSLKRSACFETIWTTVNDNYFDTTFGGVDWAAMRRKYRLLLWTAGDNRALRHLLQAMLDELRRTHFAIVPREMSVLTPEERGRIGYTGAETTAVEDRITIIRVKAASPAQKAGLKPGDVVRRVGTVVLSEMAATMSESVESPRKRMLYLRGFVNWWLSAPVGKEIVLEVEDVAGAARELKMVSVPFEGVWSEPMGFCPSEPMDQEVSRGPDGVVYLRFNLFALPAMNEFKRCVRGLTSGDGLIIDLRGNAGGITLMAPGILGRLSAKEVSLGTMHRRYGTEEFTAYPQRGAFLGPVAVLVDSASASTSEILAAGLQETGRARVFGERTAGAALPSMFRNLPTGDMLQYAVGDIKTPRGMLIEGNGVTPDETIATRRTDCVEGRDPVREAAERWLSAQRQKPSTEVAAK